MMNFLAFHAVECSRRSKQWTLPSGFDEDDS